MKRLRIALVTLCLVVSLFAKAQQKLTNAERYKINLRMLELVENYERSLRTSKSFPFSKRNFMRLYTSPTDSVYVYSDLLDFNPGSQVKVSSFAEELATRNYLTCKISNVEKGAYEWRNGKWYLPITLEKSVSYSVMNPSRMEDPAKSIVPFSSEEFYHKPFKITLHCYYDPKTGRSSIGSVDGSIESEVQHLPSRFLVVQRNGDKDRRFKIEGAPGDSLPFNKNGQAFVASGAIKAWHDDITISADTIAVTPAFDHVKLNSKIAHWRARARFAFALGSAFNVRDSHLGNLNRKYKSSGYEFGVDFGYTTPLGNSTTFGIFTGIGMSISSLSMESTSQFKYGYKAADPDRNVYQRVYTIKRMSEAVKYSDMIVPLYINFDHKLYKDLQLEWSLGAKFYINGGVNVTPFTVEGDVKAEYSDGVEGSAQALGSISGQYDRFLLPDTYSRNAVDLSLVGGLGFRYNVYKSRMFVFAKFSYEYGVTQIHKSKEMSLYSPESKIYPIVYSARVNGNVATKSFMSCVSYNRQACWLELGLTYKF